MHHIFPVNEFPIIADYIENLIALTATQHLSEAHPNNNTHYVDKNYQYMCLIAKTGSIRENLLEQNNTPKIYDFNFFLTVLNVGLNTNEFSKIETNDFSTILNKLEKYAPI